MKTSKFQHQAIEEWCCSQVKITIENSVHSYESLHITASPTITFVLCQVAKFTIPTPRTPCLHVVSNHAELHLWEQLARQLPGNRTGHSIVGGRARRYQSILEMTEDIKCKLPFQASAYKAIHVCNFEQFHLANSQSNLILEDSKSCEVKSRYWWWCCRSLRLAALIARKWTLDDAQPAAKNATASMHLSRRSCESH